MDFKKFRKISSTKSHTVYSHSDGHFVKLAHKGISDEHLKDPIQHFARGGVVEEDSNWGEKSVPNSPSVWEEEKAIPTNSYKGNIDLSNRPRVKNPDGSISTVRSVGVNLDGKEVVLPTVSPSGDNWTTAQAIDNYKRTGQHLGIYNTPEEATTAAKALHEQQAQTLNSDWPSMENAPSMPRSASLSARNQPDAPVSRTFDDPNAMVPPTAPSPQQPAMDPVAGAMTMQKAGLASEMSGMQQEAGALAQQGQAEANVFAQQQQQIADTQKRYLENRQKLETERMALQDHLMKAEINPNRVIQNMSTGSKIFSALGAMISGLGGNAGNQNSALNYMDKLIERDIEAQKASMDKKTNLLKMNIDHFKNEDDAVGMLKSFYTDTLAAQLGAAAAKAKSPQAQAKLLQAQGQLLQKSAGELEKMSARQAILGGGQPGEGQDAQVQRKLQYYREYDPKRAEDLQKRYVPGIGEATREVSEKVVGEISAKSELVKGIKELEDFAEANAGSLNPEQMKYGSAKAHDLLLKATSAYGTGAISKDDIKILREIIPTDPTAFFGKHRTLPAYKAARESFQSGYDSILRSYGLPEQKRSGVKKLDVPKFKK